MHTLVSDSAVGSTPRSLTPWWDAHRRVFWEIWWPWLRSVMHTAKLDSAVGCTPWSQTDSKMSVFCVFLLATSFDFLFLKKFEVKKIPWAICDLQYQFRKNIFRHHREIAFVKLLSLFCLYSLLCISSFILLFSISFQYLSLSYPSLFLLFSISFLPFCLYSFLVIRSFFLFAVQL